MAGVRSLSQRVLLWGGWLFLACLAAVAFESLDVSSAKLLGSSYACGAAKSFLSNGISWDSDSSVAPGGQVLTKNNANFRVFSPFNSSNPQQNTNCYNKISPPSSDGPILLRVTYQYQNYDDLNSPPQFEMWVGTTKVATIDLSQKDPWIEEVISSEPGIVCILALAGAPVVSYIELRPLPAAAYGAANDTTLLRKMYRLDCGNNNVSLRYPDDPFDRVWGVDQSASANTAVHTSSASLDTAQVSDRPPLVVLQTWRALSSGPRFSYNFEVEAAGEYHVQLYFASLRSSRSRTIFNVVINGIDQVGSVTLDGLTVQEEHYSVITSSNISVELVQAVNQPQINALEVLQLVPAGKASPDVDALNAILSYYGLNHGVGDPCLPTPWEGISCVDNVITSLDLSGQNLVQFSDLFGSLTGLTHLNLSNNRLRSTIPDLSGLVKLQVLDLHNNDLFGTLDPFIVLAATLTELFLSNNPKLSGRLPPSLNHSGLLVDVQDTCVGYNAGCPIDTPRLLPPLDSHKKSGAWIPIIGGVAAALVIGLLAMGLLCFCCHRKRVSGDTGKGIGVQQLDSDLKNWTMGKVFTYKELVSATSNFKKRLGSGSFGGVYFGTLTNGQHVAVKMRSDESQLGADSFKNEVYLLSRIHHPNLVALLGYCQEGQHELLVYEYMAGGTLSDHLYGDLPRLNWLGRLQVAVGSATGLVYLHNGSDPKIIHRDVKSNNILLDKNMVAKVSDFGLSKPLKVQATHVTTLVKGTSGYLDPEYYTTEQLTEKSDVYSFGVVLLEIVCGREPLNGDRGPQEYNLLSWAKPFLVAGTYSTIVDKSISADSPETLSRVCDLVLRCTERRGADRPSMLQVLRELEGSLALEVPEPKLASLDPKTVHSDILSDGAVDPAINPSLVFPR